MSTPDSPIGEGFTPEPDTDVSAGTRTLVVGPYVSRKQRALPDGAPAAAENLRPFEARLDEACGLAAAIDLDVVEVHLTTFPAPRPSTYLGKGKVEEVKILVRGEGHHAGGDGIVWRSPPVTAARIWKRHIRAKVIDRTGLILEIFGRRARTREGTLQVELAPSGLSEKPARALMDPFSSASAAVTAFSAARARTQIEADRRQIQERMTRIEKGARRRHPHPAACIGPAGAAFPIRSSPSSATPNAGKSTLFNRMTRAEVMAQDMLFATLDPTSRAVALPHGEKTILSDTVGFISDLPTMLVAAFRATLEDVIEADILLHVRDVSHGETEAQAADVESVLRDLDVDPSDTARIIEVWNKADLLDAPDRETPRDTRCAAARGGAPGARLGPDGGRGSTRCSRPSRIASHRGRPQYHVLLDPADGQNLNWLYENAEVMGARRPRRCHRHARACCAGEGTAAVAAFSEGAPQQGLRRSGAFYAFSPRLAACQAASISARSASSRLRPAWRSVASIAPKRRMNFTFVARKAASGSMPWWRARLATAKSRSPISSAIAALSPDAIACATSVRSSSTLAMT